MIKKYKTFEEAEKDIWVMEPDEAYYKKMQEFFRTIGKLSGFKVKPGIQKIKNPWKKGSRTQ